MGNKLETWKDSGMGYFSVKTGILYTFGALASGCYVLARGGARHYTRQQLMWEADLSWRER
jgi:hypothetical protein